MNNIAKFMLSYTGAAHPLCNIHVGSPIAGSQIRPKWALRRVPVASCASTSPPRRRERWSVVRHAPFALRSCSVHPRRLIRSDSRRVRRTGYNIMSNGMDSDCFDEDNFPSLESNAMRVKLSARAPLYRSDRKLSAPSS
ncbi:unnamed protein product [Penicillium salamii]|nr:unnamed protein product [Penicillium salamii]